MPKPKQAPAVEIASPSHYPSKAELEEDMSIPVDPEALGRMVIKDRKVTVNKDD